MHTAGTERITVNVGNGEELEQQSLVGHRVGLAHGLVTVVQALARCLSPELRTIPGIDQPADSDGSRVPVGTVLGGTDFAPLYGGALGHDEQTVLTQEGLDLLDDVLNATELESLCLIEAVLADGREIADDIGDGLI